MLCLALLGMFLYEITSSKHCIYDSHPSSRYCRQFRFALHGTHGNAVKFMAASVVSSWSHLLCNLAMLLVFPSSFAIHIPSLGHSQYYIKEFSNFPYHASLAYTHIRGLIGLRSLSSTKYPVCMVRHSKGCTYNTSNTCARISKVFGTRERCKTTRISSVPFLPFCSRPGGNWYRCIDRGYRHRPPSLEFKPIS